MNLLLPAISVMYKTVGILFTLTIAGIIYWHFFNPEFSIYSFLKWGILISAFIISSLTVLILYRNKWSENTGKNLNTMSRSSLQESDCIQES